MAAEVRELIEVIDSKKEVTGYICPVCNKNYAPQEKTLAERCLTDHSRILTEDGG